MNLNTQQSKFIKAAYQRTKDNRIIAEEFYDKYGVTEFCDNPDIITTGYNQRVRNFSAIDGHVLCTSASIMLGENWKEW